MGLGDVVRSYFTGRSGPGPADRGPQRTAGPPTSSNGASSLHLNWEVAPKPLREVSVVLEILEPPAVPELYFWALQVTFTRRGFPVGGAHIGLQHHPGYPEGGAVNWGGYHDGGGELEGSQSDLPSALDNPNTRTYRWQPNRRYRYRVSPAPTRGWRASITDLGPTQGGDVGRSHDGSHHGDVGDEIVIRDLFVDSDALAAPCVWSEVFAHCDHPGTAVRWSELQTVAVDGHATPARGVSLNYQEYRQGGCSNTDSSLSQSAAGEPAIVQRTNTTRTQPTGSRLTL